MNPGFEFGGELVWRPPPETIERAHLTHFMRRHGLADFAALLARSTQDVPWFTAAVLDYLDIEFQRPYTQVLDLSRGPAWPRWCVGGRLNIAYNCVDKHMREPDTGRRLAVIWEGEDGKVVTWTYAELYRQVNHCANLLRELGFRKGEIGRASCRE